MRRKRVWLIISLALLLAIGTFTLSFAAKTTDKAAVANEPTRDTRTLFGHDVEGLKPVSLIYSSDAPFNSLSDVLLLGLKRLIETESKGKIKIDLHRHGSLYKTNDLPKVMPIGTVHMGIINKGILMSREPGYAPWIIGYVWKSPEHIFSLVASPEWYAFEEEMSKRKWNLKPLVSSTIGNWDYWSKKEIKSMKDFGGKRVWSYGELSNAYIASWGGTPVMKSVSEMYMAYYKDAINAISFSVNGYLDYRFYEGGKYWLNMPIYPPRSTGLHYVQIYMNRDKWNSLPVAYKKIILDACDLMCWNGCWESICMDQLAQYRLMNQHQIVDVGISTKHPEEYEKIKTSAIEAGRKFVFKRGVSQAQWDEAQTILKKYADDKYTSQYSWWFKLAWAEADRRVAEVKKMLAAGKTWNEAYEAFHIKQQYNYSYEQLQKEWYAVPRIKWNWPEEMRLQ